MHPPPPAQRPPSEGRDWRGQAMEEMMLLWTIAELMYLTRNELCDLADQIVLKLPEFNAGTIARHNALTTLTISAG